MTVTLDMYWQDSLAGMPISVKVVGIEDLIAEQIALSMAHRVPAHEISILVQVLHALGREGVGGRLRAPYLQRRLAWETNGEVVLEPFSVEEAMIADLAPRSTTLARMWELISAWRAQCGLSFRPPCVSRLSGDRTQAIRHRDDGAGRAGRSCATRAQLVPFDVALSAPPL